MNIKLVKQNGETEELEITEEEKRAVEILNVINDTKYTCHYYTLTDLKAIDTVLNLIEKQQKEIEKLNKYALEDLKDLNNYIPKHKIRELLKYHKEQIKLVSSYEFYNQELGYVEALEELLKGE